MNEERIYGATKLEGGCTSDDIRQMSRKEKIEMMVEWFHDHFEDPAERTPYESREGGYQWIWGGPHNADQEIQEEFLEVVDFETMQEAVREVENDGLYEWAPAGRWDDYDDNNDKRIASGEIVDGDGEWPPIIAVDETEIDEPSARSEVIRRLDHLEELIRPLVESGSMIGHNQPPEPISDLPVSRDEWQDVAKAVGEIRAQTRIDRPEDRVIETRTSTLRRAVARLAVWVQKRLEKGVDAYLVAVGTAAGASTVVNLAAIVDALRGAIRAIGTWIQSLPLPF